MVIVSSEVDGRKRVREEEKRRMCGTEYGPTVVAVVGPCVVFGVLW